MNSKRISAAWLAWSVLVVLFVAASLTHVYARGFVVMVFLAPLTVFLVIRGILRWTGKQWRHSSETREPAAR
jgi:hypothetical protein